MSVSKRKSKTETEIEIEPEGEPEAEEKPEVAEVSEPEIEGVEFGPEEAPVPGAKKALGVKEVIPFKWKVVGRSAGLMLTLFKSVIREDADGHLDRLQREGYYTDLQVVDVAVKNEAPKVAVLPPPPEKPAAPPKEKKKPRSGSAAPKKPAQSPIVVKESRKPKPTKSAKTAAKKTKNPPRPVSAGAKPSSGRTGKK